MHTYLGVQPHLQMLFGFQQGDCIPGYLKEKMIKNLSQDANKDANRALLSVTKSN